MNNVSIVSSPRNHILGGRKSPLIKRRINMKKKYLVLSLLVVALVGFTIAATTWDMSWPRFDRLWVGESSDTPGNTLGSNSVYVKGDLEIDGALYIDGGITGTGVITGTNVADVTRGFEIPITALWIDASPGTMGIDGSSAPGLATTDVLPKVVWASGEVTSVSYTFMVPPDYVSSLGFRVMVSSNISTSVALWGLRWAVKVNEPVGGFYTYTYASYEQTYATCPTTTSPAVSNALLTLTVSEAIPAVTINAGDLVTVDLWPYDIRTYGAGGGTTEIYSIQARYTATQ